MSSIRNYGLALILWMALASQSIASSAQSAVAPDHPVNAVQGIVAALQKHPVVVIGEWHHGIRQMGDFYTQLVNDRAFQQTVQDIVVEFVSRTNQPLLDRYIAGEEIPIEQVQHLWRDTTKTGSWEFPIYAQWLAAIRQVNRTLPVEHRLRVLAGDTAVDWSQIRTHADWERLGDNNRSFADVILDEVLVKHRKALVVLGGNHVAKMGHNGAPNASTIIEKRFPGALYVVIHRLIPNDPDESHLRLPGNPLAPSLYDLSGTMLGDKPDANGVAPIRYVDAWLYVGPADTMVQSLPAVGSLEPSYLRELDRRSMIEWGDLRIRKFLFPSSAH